MKYNNEIAVGIFHFGEHLYFDCTYSQKLIPVKKNQSDLIAKTRPRKTLKIANPQNFCARR